MNLKVLPCGHITHLLCWKEMIQKGIFACPLCGLCTTDMTDFWHELDEEIANTPMPEEYRNVMVWILCKDCHKVSETPFHVIGLRCVMCGSYNTCRTAEPACHKDATQNTPADDSVANNEDDHDDESRDSTDAVLTNVRVESEYNGSARAEPDLGTTSEDRGHPGPSDDVQT